MAETYTPSPRGRAACFCLFLIVRPRKVGLKRAGGCRPISRSGGCDGSDPRILQFFLHAHQASHTHTHTHSGKHQAHPDLGCIVTPHRTPTITCSGAVPTGGWCDKHQLSQLSPSPSSLPALATTPAAQPCHPGPCNPPCPSPHRYLRGTYLIRAARRAANPDCHFFPANRSAPFSPSPPLLETVLPFCCPPPGLSAHHRSTTHSASQPSAPFPGPACVCAAADAGSVRCCGCLLLFAQRLCRFQAVLAPGQ